MNVFKKLSSVPPLWFLLVYLTSVVVFGLLYAFVTPAGFIAPYARYEPSAYENQQKIEKILEDGIMGNGISSRQGLPSSGSSMKGETIRTPYSFTNSNGVVDQVATFFVLSLKITELEVVSPRLLKITFSIDGCEICEDDRIQTLYDEMEVQLDIGVDNGVYTPFAVPAEAKLDLRTPRVTGFVQHAIGGFFHPEEEAQIAKGLYEGLFPRSLYKGGHQTIVVSKKDLLELRRFASGILGDPSNMPRQLPRMIYLSAVVITTLGLGDIVPVTDVARLLVGLEAVLGVTIAGLFINAVASNKS